MTCNNPWMSKQALKDVISTEKRALSGDDTISRRLGCACRCVVIYSIMHASINP